MKALRTGLGCLIVMAASTGAHAATTPLDDLLTAFVDQKRIDTFEHLDGVVVHRNAEEGSLEGTLSFTSDPFKNVAVPFTVYFPNRDFAKPPMSVVLDVPPVSGKSKPESDYVGLLQRQLSGKQVGLLFHDCAWDEGGMYESTNHEAFAKVVWPDGTRKLFVGGTAYDYRDQDTRELVKQSHLYIDVEYNAKLPEDMECKAGDTQW